MANVTADNATSSETLYWLDIDTDTPGVWAYNCPGGGTAHPVVSPVKLQFTSAGSATGASATCPVHQLVLTNAGFIDCSVP